MLGASVGTEQTAGLEYSVCLHQSHGDPATSLFLRVVLPKSSSQHRVGSKRKQAETAGPVDFFYFILLVQALMDQNQGGRKRKTSPLDGAVAGSQCRVACGIGDIVGHHDSHAKHTDTIPDIPKVSSNYGTMNICHMLSGASAEITQTTRVEG